MSSLDWPFIYLHSALQYNDGDIKSGSSVFLRIDSELLYISVVHR